MKQAFGKFALLASSFGVMWATSVYPVEAQQFARVRVFWTVSAPPGALYFNICADPDFNNNPVTGGCGKVDVLNENVTNNKDRFRFVDDRLVVGQKYKACLFADNTPSRPGRWMDCENFVATDGAQVAFYAHYLNPIRANP